MPPLSAVPSFERLLLPSPSAPLEVSHSPPLLPSPSLPLVGCLQVFVETFRMETVTRSIYNVSSLEFCPPASIFPTGEGGDFAQARGPFFKAKANACTYKLVKVWHHFENPSLPCVCRFYPVMLGCGRSVKPFRVCCQNVMMED